MSSSSKNSITGILKRRKCQKCKKSRNLPKQNSGHGSTLFMDTVVLCRNFFGNNFSLLGCASYFKVQNLLLRTKFRKSHYSSLSTWGSLVPSKYHQSSLDQLEFSTQFKANKRTSLYKKKRRNTNMAMLTEILRFYIFLMVPNCFLCQQQAHEDTTDSS